MCEELKADKRGEEIAMYRDKPNGNADRTDKDWGITNLQSDE